MKKSVQLHKRFLAVLIGALIVTAKVFSASAEHALPQDTLQGMSVPSVEMGGMLKKQMATSPFPIQMKMQGRSVCVRSNYNQVLPIYNRYGGFYALFRLSKGVNWINGIPQGIYYINNRKVVIP